MGILPVLVLLAGKMPAPQEILGYFFNWKSLNEFSKIFFNLIADLGKKSPDGNSMQIEKISISLPTPLV